MAMVALHLLGAPWLEVDGAEVHVGRRKAMALLAYLAVTRRSHTRDALAALLWPDLETSSARGELRRHLSLLNQLLGGAGMEGDRETVRLNLDLGLWLDVAAFRAQLGACAGHGHPVTEVCPDCVALLEGAVALYTDPFMVGFTLEDSAAFDEWQFFETEALKDEVASALVRLATYRTSQGDFERAITYARRWLAVDPLHEPAHRHLMVLYARSNQRAAALRQYETCERLLREELGAEPSAPTRQTYQQILKGEALLAPTAVEAVLERELREVRPCPYRGLAAFGEADAPFFFGREAYVAQIAHAILCAPYVAAVVGASGSGKSSLVYAGLLPRLREGGDWRVVACRPGTRPFYALATALMPALEPDLHETGRMVEAQQLAEALSGGDLRLSAVIARIREKDGGHRRVLLFVDQFEELYTLCPDPQERRRYIDSLLEACAGVEATHRGQGGLSCLLTLRADFLAQVLAYRRFSDALQPAVRLLGPMTREELRAAIEKPSEAQGAAFEAGLVARLLDDVGDEPGNLPLLEFALTLLWERLDFGWLTHAAYEAIGRVEGALARYAQEVYEALPEVDRQAARRVFTQLVQPGEGTEDTRRVATYGELGEETRSLVQYLADQRLVVTGRDAASGTEAVEVVHEALIRSWGQLQAWMTEDRAFRTWQERLRIGVHMWESTDHDEGALLRGVSLAEAEEWLRNKGRDLGENERSFVEAGIALRQRRAAERDAQRQAELEAARQLQEAHDVALRQAAAGLASEARLQMKGPNQDLAVLLALEALEAFPSTSKAELALAEIVRDFRLMWQFAHGNQLVAPAVVSPDGMWVATASHDGMLRVWDACRGDTLFEVATYPGTPGTCQWAAWSPLGNRILTGSFEGSPRTWDAETGRFVAELADAVWANGAWSPDGKQVVSSGGYQGVVQIWDAETGQIIWRVASERGRVSDAWFSPDGKWIATSRGDVWNATTGELRYTLAVCRDPARADVQIDLHWSPDGTRMGGGLDGTAWVWDASTGEELLRLPVADSGASNLWWSPAGDRILTTGIKLQSVPATLWDGVTGARLREFPYYGTLMSWPGPWSADGGQILLPDDQGRVTVWEADSGRALLSLPAHVGKAYAQWLSGDEGFVTAGSSDGLVRAWRLPTAELTFRSGTNGPPPEIAVPWSPDGEHVAQSYTDGTIRICNILARTEVVRTRRITDHPWKSVGSLAWSPDGGQMLMAAAEGSPEIWDSMCRERLLSFGRHRSLLMGAVWSPDGRRVISFGRDCRTVLWDAATGSVLAEVTGPEFSECAWSPDGSRIVLCSRFSTGGRPVEIRDAETLELLLTLLPDDFGYGTSAAVWSPDGTRIVTFSGDGMGRLWFASTGDLQGTFPTTTAPFEAHWSPSGSRFLVGFCPGIDVWDAATLQKVDAFPAEGEFALGAWSPDGRAIAISYAKGDLAIYPAWESLEELIAYAKAHCVLRELTSEERARYGLRA